MNITHGRVYVVKRGEGLEKQKLLEDVTFRNMDRKLYSPDGSVSPLYEKYYGHPYRVQFYLGHKDKNGVFVEGTYSIKMAFALGTNSPLDVEGVIDQHEEMDRWMKSVRILSDAEPDDYGFHVARTTLGAAFISALCPGWKVSEMWCLHINCDAMFIMDEYLDNGDNCRAMPFKDAQPYWSLMTAVLEGKVTPEEQEEMMKIYNLPAAYKKFGMVVRETRNIVTKDEHEAGQHVINIFRIFYDAAKTENCQELKRHQARNSVMYTMLEPELRFTRCGCPWTVELCLYCQGVNLPPVVRDSFLFKSIVRYWAMHASLLNDAISSKKEMGDKTSCNRVIMDHVQDGMELPDAWEKAFKEVDLLEKLIYETGQLILEFYGEYEDAWKLVHIMDCCTDGNTAWHGITLRYLEDFVFDCVIEVD